ncbi:MAG: carbamoyltransferase HypF [Negativicutes bacterium]|nr:carbamoyltransferase HypF [Negativicutes bacterium]
MVRYAVEIQGIVQGVGFRPFVYRIANSFSLAGFVLNTSQGVSLEIEGSPAACAAFLTELQENPPSMALIEKITVKELPLRGEPGFRILASLAGTRNAMISPDIGICADCMRDITEKGNRRYHYAFTNCTNCGPRFTIIRDIPYDRKNTTMAEFTQCEPCQKEYEDPADRRFHAQPNACPDCGPHLSFYEDGESLAGDVYDLFQSRIAAGKIVAVKGIGGYHLVCDARNEAAVQALRQRKLRYDKPFAVMMPDLATAEKYCVLNQAEQKALTSTQKPIVLLQKKPNCPIAFNVSQNNRRLGVMLPYTPLHYLLLQNQEVLVMTSGNLSDRPMVFQDEAAFTGFSRVADAVLTHNRRIHRRMDDSVCIVVNDRLHLLRRARGFVPEPFCLPGNRQVILALGAQQKNTFCLAKRENAFLSGHIGDLDDADTEKSYTDEIAAFLKIFEALPAVIACDYHPDYLSSRYAVYYQKSLNEAFQKANKTEQEIQIIPIQHHHAHFASVLAEHDLNGEQIFGLIFDGSGLGDDGSIWGGEALFGNTGSSRRVGHLLPFRLLGGETAIREPWRVALAVTAQACDRDTALDLFPEDRKTARILLQAGEKEINSPLTSSMGRLFDAVAALAGICPVTTYEGQAAIELQQSMDTTAAGSYHFVIEQTDEGMLFDWRPLLRAVLTDRQNAVPAGGLSLRFHRAVVELIVQAAILQRQNNGSQKVVLSGGVFQNEYLLSQTMTALQEQGFTVYSNEKIPTNDGGIAFGQAAAVAYRMR